MYVSSQARISKYFLFNAYIKIDTISRFPAYRIVLPRLIRPIVFLNWTALAKREESSLQLASINGSEHVTTGMWKLHRITRETPYPP